MHHENVQTAIADQLRRRNIEVVTARDLGVLGDEDRNHLERATRVGHVLCTHDSDYVNLADAGQAHAGIIFGQQHKHSIGDWVNFLELVDAVDTPDDMRNLIEYV